MTSECRCDPPREDETVYCERHGCDKTLVLWEKCQERGKWWRAWEAGKGPGQPGASPAPKNNTQGGCGEQNKTMGLGDCVEKALSYVGITEERVTRWLGRPCNCAERKRRLNEIGRWASRALGLSCDDAAEELEEVLEA